MLVCAVRSDLNNTCDYWPYTQHGLPKSKLGDVEKKIYIIISFLSYVQLFLFFFNLNKKVLMLQHNA